MSCPGLHCDGCAQPGRGGGCAAVIAIAAAAVAVELLEWIAAHALELMVVTAMCVAMAIGAVVALFRWAARRDARHAAERPFLTAREVPAVTATVRREIAAPAIHLHFHGATTEAAAIIRNAITSKEN
jgi:hypothetical protein